MTKTLKKGDVVTFKNETYRFIVDSVWHGGEIVQECMQVNLIRWQTFPFAAVVITV